MADNENSVTKTVLRSRTKRKTLSKTPKRLRETEGKKLDFNAMEETEQDSMMVDDLHAADNREGEIQEKKEEKERESKRRRKSLDDEPDNNDIKMSNNSQQSPVSVSSKALSQDAASPKNSSPKSTTTTSPQSLPLSKENTTDTIENSGTSAASSLLAVTAFAQEKSGTDSQTDGKEESDSQRQVTQHNNDSSGDREILGTENQEQPHVDYYKLQNEREEVELDEKEKSVNHQTPLRGGTSSSMIPENQNNEGNNSKIESKLIFNIITGIIWILIFAVSYNLLKSPTSSRKLYCDSQRNLNTVTKNCIPCPANGYCADGEIIQCKQDLIIRDGLCVKKGDIAIEFMDIMRNQLNSLAVNAICYNSHERKYINEVEIRAQLGSMMNPKEQFDKIWNRFRDYASNSGLFDSVTNIDGEILWSVKDPRLPTTCILRERIIQKWQWIAGIAVFCVLLFILSLYRKKLEQMKKYKEDVVSIVLTKLRNAGGPLSLSDLKYDVIEEYSNVIPNIEDLWPEVIEAIEADLRIKEDVNHESKTWEFVDFDDTVSFASPGPKQSNNGFFPSPAPTPSPNPIPTRLDNE